jgi:hypothetical protein
VAIDRTNTAIPNDKTPDVSAAFLHIFLDVEDGMVIAPQDLFMLQDRFGRIAIIDLRKQSPPRTGIRLDDAGVAQLIHGRQGRFRGEGKITAGRRDAGLDDSLCGQELAPADLGHLIGVDRRDTEVLEDLNGVDGPRMVHASFDDHIERIVVFVKIEDDFPVIDAYYLDAGAAAKFVQEEFLLFPDNGMY